MEPRVYTRSEHTISRSLIAPHVLKVLYRLKEADHQAYVVGGAVRDLLRGGQPKDFDIATDATPSQLRGLFRNSRIIGRRFRLAHIVYGEHVVEVATMRRAAEPQEDREDQDDLYIDDDNCWGDVESDAFRRDFTINALFYNIADFSVIDYVGGVDDIRMGIVRAIGDPWTRFREDPVRMLRALKFAARFGYRIEPETGMALRELAGEILKASRMRVIEEFFRLLTQTNRAGGLALLHEHRFLEILFPDWTAAVGEAGLEQTIAFLAKVDREAEAGRHLPIELVAGGLFLPLLDTVDPHAEPYDERSLRLSEELRLLAAAMEFPKRLSASVTLLLRGQLHLLYFPHRPNQVRRFVTRAEFDWVWRLHDLAFGDEPRLSAIQEVWLAAREALPTPMGGWVDRPDRRDVFSFRGRTGGGRYQPGETPDLISARQGRQRSGDGGRRRTGGPRRRR